MTRKKVKLMRIGNDAARKASLKKRRGGLCKKVQELHTLCGVDAFVIVYGPDETEPVTWPTIPEVKEMIEKYKTIPQLERSKKMTNLESYLKERINKLEDNVKKDSKKNRDAEMSHLMHKLRLHGGHINCLEQNEKHCLISLLEERMRDYQKRMDYFQQVPPLVPSTTFVQAEQEQQELPPPFAPPQRPPFPLPPSNVQERVHGGSGEFRANPTDSMMWDHWFQQMVRNSDNTAGGSGSSAPRPPPLSRGLSLGAFGGIDNDAGTFGLHLPFGGGNPFEMAMAQPNPNPFGIQGDFEGRSSSLFLGGLGSVPPHTPDIGGIGEIEGLTRSFPSGSDVARFSWPPNFSP